MTPIPSSPVQSQRGTDERERLIALVDQVGDACDWIPHAEQLWAAADMLRADAEQLRARDEEIAALRKDAERWAVVAAAARRGNFGEWVIFPDEPHDRGDVKAQFVLDIDAALQENPK